MYALIYIRYLHSYVLLFLCLYYFRFRALADICAFIKIRSLVLARDDESRALCEAGYAR